MNMELFFSRFRSNLRWSQNKQQEFQNNKTEGKKIDLQKTTELHFWKKKEKNETRKYESFDGYWGDRFWNRKKNLKKNIQFKFSHLSALSSQL